MDSLKNVVSCFMLLFVLALGPASAFGLTVTNTNDSGPGSLRDAVLNTPPGGVVDFDSSLAGSTITLLSEIVILKNLTIEGLGADELTISGGGATRLFAITSPATFFRIADVRITGGNSNGSFPGQGGAILISFVGRIEIDRCVFAFNSAEVFGGAVFIGAPNSEIVINDSAFSNNSISNTGSPIGGAIMIVAGETNIEINRSTFNNNSLSTTFDEEAIGGAIGVVSSFDTITITNSTFSENSAVCATGCDAIGGAIGLLGESVWNFNNNTFSGNTADCGPGCEELGNTIGALSSSPITFYSNIIANSPGEANCGILGISGFSSLGYNIATDASCVNGSVTGDRANTNPGLDPAGLRSNGGPTQTIAIFDTSEAFDTGDPACPPPSTDQRGVPRPQAEVCDVGSYELIVRMENIPTLSEWGMTAAAAGFGLLGAFYAARRRKASA